MFLPRPGSKDDSTYIVQTLDFHLGHNTMVTKPCGALESPMATITKITRRRHENPPHGVATVKEWFNYVTAMRNEGNHHTQRGTSQFCLSGNDSTTSALLSLSTELIPDQSDTKVTLTCRHVQQNWSSWRQV